jgi:neutral ceramidase
MGPYAPNLRRTCAAQRNAEEGYLLMDALGRIVGQEVVRVAGNIQRMSAEARIEAGERVVSVPAKIPDSGGGFQHDDMLVESVESLQIHLGLLLINRIAITAVSGEVVTKIYWRLRRESPFTNTLMVTMANDRIDNIVDDAAYDAPTFEVTSQY